ncbi:MAG: hypothetical protein V3S33_04105 [Gammaproteobacteria bacterium]
MNKDHKLGETSLIIAAGMQRSASTWLYNAARAVLCSNPAIQENLSAGWVDDWDLLPHSRYCLIKTHTFEPTLVTRAQFLLYSYRDVRDVLASMKRKFNFTPTVENVGKLIYQHSQWIEKADFVMRYETMLGEKEPIIAALADLFGIENVEPASINEQLNALSYRSQGQKNPTYHNVNLYHQGHFTDGRHGSWVDTLDSSLVKQIEDKYRSWFDANDYPVES